jgi:hypothetical protein
VKCIPIMCAAVLATEIALATGQRTTLRMSLPRANLGAAISGDLLVLGGGEVPWYIDPTERTGQVDIFDLSTMTLINQGALPVPVSFLTAGAIGGRVYFGPGLGAVPMVQILELASMSWTTYMLPGSFRAFVDVVTDDRWLCLVGGSGASPTNWIDVYDSASDRWHHTTAPTTEQNKGALLNGRLYVVSCSAAGQPAQMMVLDLETLTWSTVPRPFARCIPYTGVLEPFVIFSSGRGPSLPWFIDSTDVFNTLTREWHVIPGGGDLRFAAAAAASSAGQFLIGGGQRGQGFTDGTFRVDILSLASHLGASYCPALAPNSTGRPARMRAVGMTSVIDNYLTLAAHDAPPGQLGLFLVGTAPTITPMSSGNLCVGSPVGLLTQFVRTVEATGTLAATIDLTHLPLSPTRAAQPGETLYFQAIVRDVAPGPPMHFSDALAVTLTL